jgi:hypothetical protein
MSTSATPPPKERQIAQVVVEDEFLEQLGLVEHRVALVERLVGLAEALQVDGDNPVVLGERRCGMPPCICACAEAVDEEDRLALALLFVEQLDRRLGRPEPCEARPFFFLAFVGAMGRGAAKNEGARNNGGEAEYAVQDPSCHPSRQVRAAKSVPSSAASRR